MKAILITEPPYYELTRLPDPRCGPGQVLVRTAFCGICGTDLEILRGTMPGGCIRYPIVPGHEWTGVIEEVGPGVEGLQPGDPVSAEGVVPCGVCHHCHRGETNLCSGREQIGMTQNGGLAEYVVAPAKLCHVVPQHLGLDEALMVEPAATVVRGIARAGLQPGLSAAVIGCGNIGQIAARVLALYEPSMILGIDVSEFQRSAAERAGFTRFTTSRDPAELRAVGGNDGWDVVVHCARGPRPLELAFSIVRTGGRIVVIGGCSDRDRLNVPANSFVMRDLRVNGVLGYTTSSWIDTLGLLSNRKLKLGDLITHRVLIEDFSRAVGLIETRTEPVGKVAIAFP